MGRPKGSKTKKVKETIVKTDAVGSTGCKVTVSEEVVIDPKRLELAKKLASEINRAYGEGVVKFASEILPAERISTGNKHINTLTGGVPHGHFTIFWGGSSCGKTTAVLNVIAQAQKQGKICALVDAEHSFDPVWAKFHGVNLETLLLFHEFKTAEDALDTVVKIMESKAVDLLIIDSVSALSPKEEQESAKGKERSIGDDQMASLAKRLSKFFRISTGGVYKAKCAVLLVVQTRTNIGGFIAFEQLSGGNALRHYPVMIVSFRRGSKADAPVKKVYNSKTKENESVPIGFAAVLKMDKTKISGTEKEGSELDIPFYFEKGFGEEVE